MRPTDAEQLCKRYQPKSFAEMLGQPYLVKTLAEFVDRPYPCAMIFSGGTGLGKTTMADVLAREMGVDQRADWLEYDSGELDGETLEEVKAQLRLYPWQPGGWRVVVFNEADLMTRKAEALFLSLLDNLPERTVLIFTTNRPEWFRSRQRLIDRCELFEFDAEAVNLRADAEAFAARVWAGETGRDDAPPIDLDTVAVDGALSFRRVAKELAAPIRAANGEQPERFGLAAKPAKPRTIFDVCGPFGVKPSRATVEAAPVAPPAVAAPASAVAPAAVPGPSLPSLAGRLVAFHRERIAPAPAPVVQPARRSPYKPLPDAVALRAAALAWIEEQPDEPRPHAVTRRFSMGQAAARELIASVWVAPVDVA